MPLVGLWRRLLEAAFPSRVRQARAPAFGTDADWHYHTLRGPDGRPFWEGQFDLYPLWPRFGIPESLAGSSVLDIGTATGFFAFECEKRGADPVVATELEDVRAMDSKRDRPWNGVDIPRRNQEDFQEAARRLASRVKVHWGSIASPLHEALGQFDWVIFGALLTHVRDPMLCLEHVRALTRGRAVVVASYVPGRRDAMYWLHGERPFDWWVPTKPLVPRMLAAAGFRRVEETGDFELVHRNGLVQRQACWHAFP